MSLAGKSSHSPPLTPMSGPHIILGIRGPRPRLLTGSSRSQGLRGPCFCISKPSCCSWATENFSLENGVYQQINRSQELSTRDLWITRIYRIHFLVCKAEQNQKATRNSQRTVSFLYKTGQDVLEESPCFQEHGALSPPCGRGARVVCGRGSASTHTYTLTSGRLRGPPHGQKPAEGEHRLRHTEPQRTGHGSVCGARKLETVCVEHTDGKANCSTPTCWSITDANGTS